MRQKTCSACGGKMQSLGNMELQKGKFSMLFGNLSQIMSGALDVDVECCERCKKLEFYLLGDPEEPETSGIEQIACPYCGDKGTLTPLQAVCSALAGCVGTGNIAGVATAMVVGGPGAVFWMWVIALLGMMTKCVEVTLGQYYRIKGKDGVYYGGLMYYIERGMGKKWKPLAIFFAVTIILGGLGTAAFTQPYTMSTAVQRTTSARSRATGRIWRSASTAGTCSTRCARSRMRNARWSWSTV